MSTSAQRIAESRAKILALFPERSTPEPDPIRPDDWQYLPTRNAVAAVGAQPSDFSRSETRALFLVLQAIDADFPDGLPQADRLDEIEARGGPALREYAEWIDAHAPPQPDPSDYEAVLAEARTYHTALLIAKGRRLLTYLAIYQRDYPTDRNAVVHVGEVARSVHRLEQRSPRAAQLAQIELRRDATTGRRA